MDDEKTTVGGPPLMLPATTTKPKRRRNVKREVHERFFTHWVSTVLGLVGGLAEIFFGFFDEFIKTGNIVDITAMSGPELKARLIKGVLIAAVGSLGRFGNMYRYRREDRHG